MKKTRAKLISIPRDELLTLAMEEAAELIIELAKTRRWGSMNYHPEDEKKVVNRERIRREWEDLDQILKVWFERSVGDELGPNFHMHKDRSHIF